MPIYKNIPNRYALFVLCKVGSVYELTLLFASKKAFEEDEIWIGTLSYCKIVSICDKCRLC